ncbi:MAG: M81 family metallopeptidase [Chloroflexi bacterium]|nr:M81 family metallopeptidase [Chloroflexota bacterium]
MKIAIGTISHETNTFSNIPTNRDEFAKQGISFGQEIIDRFAGTQTIEGAFIDAARQYGFDLLPTIYATAIPGGVIPRETLDFFLDNMLDAIRRAGTVDGVQLQLHGAAVVEGIDDPEGFILQALRQLVGKDVPIVSTLDLHANMTEEMVSNADILVGYDTYPHVDQYERAREVADLLMRIKGGLRPVGALEKPPLMPPLQTGVTTTDTPMRMLMEMAHAVEKEKGIITASVFSGFPFADIPPAGLGVLVYADNDPALARIKAREISAAAMAAGDRWLVHPVPVKEAVEKAMAAPSGPVILADIADSGAGGTSGDGTAILEELLNAGAKRVAISTISDQEVIDQAIAAGVGKTITAKVGGKRDKYHGEPVEVTGMVRLIHEGSFRRRGPQSPGIIQTIGRTVVLEIGGIDGIELILSEHRAHPNDLEYFRAFGIEPTERQALVLKSAAHFRAAFEPIAAQVIEVDAPGITSPRLERFPYRRIRRPIYPLDPM